MKLRISLWLEINSSRTICSPMGFLKRDCNVKTNWPMIVENKNILMPGKMNGQRPTIGIAFVRTS